MQDETNRYVAETKRIRTELQKASTLRRADLISGGQFMAETALRAAQTAYSLQSGEDLSGTPVGRRSTLIGGARVGRTTTSAAAAVAPVTGTPTATTSAAAITATRATIQPVTSRPSAFRTLLE